MRLTLIIVCKFCVFLVACVFSTNEADETEATSASIVASTPRDVQIDVLAQFSGCGTFCLPPTLHIAGATLSPATKYVPTALVEASTAGGVNGTVNRSIRYNLLDLNLAAPAISQTIYSGSPSMLGVAATSYRDTAGNTNALFLFVNNGQAFVFDVSGVSGLAPPVRTNPAPISGFPHSAMDATVLPAIEYGEFGGQKRVLIAFSRWTGGYRWIELGQLTRLSSGVWSFGWTGWLMPSTVGLGDCPDGFFDRFSMAFDKPQGRWGVTWECDGDLTGEPTSYFSSTTFSGVENPNPPMLIHILGDAPHTGPSIAFNRFSGAYLIGLQHNSGRVVRNAAGVPSCDRDPGGNCVDGFQVLGVKHLGLHGQWAIEADYWSGLEFRVAGNCILSGYCDQVGSGALVSEELEQGGLPPVWHGEPEGTTMPGAVGAVRASGENEAHAYVRVPARAQTVILHLWEKQNTPWGSFRFSIVDEVSTVPFDD